MQPTNDLAAPDPRRWWTLGVLALSLIVISLDNTILNVALPTLERDLDASASQLQWIVDSYMLVFAGLLLTAGALGDRFGRKRALTFGLVVFGAGSLASAFAGSADALIVTRALMGVGAAFIMPSTLSILTAVFPPAERAKAIGVWAAVSGLGIAIGPVAGGFLLEHFSWGSIFLVNVPIVIGAILAGRRLIPESLDPSAPRLDLAGFGLSTVGLVALVWSIIEAPTKGWADPAILSGFGVAAVFLAAFVTWELRVKEPMLDVRLFSNPRFSAASGAIALAFFSLFGAIFFLTQFLQSVLGYSALEAGLGTLPVAGGLMVAAALSAPLAERIGTKIVVAAGMTVVAGGLVLVGSAEVYTDAAIALAVLGAGIGLAMAPATDSIMGSLPLAKASVGSAVNDTTRTAGGALGVAVLGSILASQYRGDMESAVAGLPDSAAVAAQDSLAGALAVADRMGPGGERLAEVARDAFVAGMHSAAFVAAAIALAGAVLAAIALPARERAEVVRAEPVPA
jgi:EmrB/QacA subfamily drug resistance transporter